MTKGNRKIGLGVMGFADMLLRLQVPYDSEEACRLAAEVMSFIHDEARAESEELARERGVFPNFEGSIFDRPDRRPRAQRHRHHHRADRHHQHHRRLLQRHRADLRAQLRARNVLDDDRMVEVHPYFEEVARERGFFSEELMKKIADVGTARHVRRHARRRAAACSSPPTTSRPSGTSGCRRRSRRAPTTPCPRRSTSPTRPRVDDVENVYRMAFRTGCKGVTIYRDGSRDKQVLNVGQTKKKREPDPAIGGIATTRPSRPQLLTGETQRMDTGCGKLFVIMNDDEYGAREVFANMGKAGGCASSNTEALGRLISLALKKGASPQEVVEQLKGIRCHVPYGMGPNATLSCADAIGKALERRYVAGAAARADSDPEPQLSLVEAAAGACASCGGVVRHEGGCTVCCDPGCGYSNCG